MSRLSIPILPLWFDSHAVEPFGSSVVLLPGTTQKTRYDFLTCVGFFGACVATGGYTLYGTIRLRELHIMFLLVNALMYFFPPQPMLIAGLSVTYPEILSVAWVTSMLVAFFMSFQLNLRQLNEEKP
jgi:hypothetical protein